MKKLFLVVFFLLLFCFAPFKSFAANSLDVVINEIAWMGTTVSPNDEWIELYNNTNTEINLDGWGLYEEGGKTLIEPLTGIIGAKSYYLIERTDDDTVPNIEASQSPTGWGGYGLNNNGEYLQLFDSNSNIIDEVDCSGGWFAGIGKPEYKTMERINPLVSGNESLNWQTNTTAGGTPKIANSTEQIVNNTEQIAEELKSEEQSIDKTTENSSQLSYPDGIVFNEILPSPKDADETEEWIEIYNNNNFEVDLSNWKIQDSIGAVTTFIFSNGTKIGPNGYLVLKRPQTKITMNNSGDKLVLFRPDGNVFDSVEFEKAPLNSSYNRVGSEWKWSGKLTPGVKNIIESNPSLIGTGAQKQSNNDNIDDKIVADLTKGVENAKPFSFLFFGAILLAIISVIIFFLLKIKIKKQTKP